MSKLTAEMMIEAFNKAKNQGLREPSYEVSPAEYELGLKVIKLKPDVVLTGSVSIQYWARKLGLISE